MYVTTLLEHVLFLRKVVCMIVVKHK